MGPVTARENTSTPQKLLRTPARRAVAYTVAVAILAFAVSTIFSILTTDEPGSCATEEIFSCMSANRLILTFAPSVILALGGLGAFAKTLTTWRAGGPWMVWHASGWALFILMILFVGTAGGGLITQ